MNKVINIFINLLAGLLFLAAIAVISYPLWKDLIRKPPLPPSEPNTFVHKKQKSYDISKNNPMERIRSRKTRASFEITGYGENGKWGTLKSANFNYILTVETESRILKKEVLPETGRFVIEEERLFNIVRDDIVATDADIKLSLNEDALDLFALGITGIGYVANMVHPGWGTVIIGSGGTLIATLKKLNEKSIKEFAKAVSMSDNEAFQDLLNAAAGGDVKHVLGLSGIRSISGQKFIITWYQHDNGTPFHLVAKKSDESEITDEEEMILSRLNIFLDYDVVPNREIKAGDKWIISANDIEETLDPFTDGHFTGDISISVKERNEKGDWYLEMSRCPLQMTGDGGQTYGNIEIESGNAIISPQHMTVEKMTASGKADVNHLSRHHLLFKTKVKGDCKFTGVLKTEPIYDIPSKGASVSEGSYVAPESPADANGN